MENLEGVVQEGAAEGKRGLEECNLMWIMCGMDGNDKRSGQTEGKIEK